MLVLVSGVAVVVVTVFISCIGGWKSPAKSPVGSSQWFLTKARHYGPLARGRLSLLKSRVKVQHMSFYHNC